MDSASYIVGRTYERYYKKGKRGYEFKVSPETGPFLDLVLLFTSDVVLYNTIMYNLTKSNGPIKYICV